MPLPPAPSTGNDAGRRSWAWSEELRRSSNGSADRLSDRGEPLSTFADSSLLAPGVTDTPRPTVREGGRLMVRGSL